MKTVWMTDPRFLEHDTGRGHPERPDRLRAMAQAVADCGLLDRVIRLRARPAADEDVLAVHSPQYLARLEVACDTGAPYIDVPDSAICPASYDIALWSAGGVLAACDAVATGQADNAFCAVRPPGHHCNGDRTMGFCLLNNIAMAARYLQRRYGVGKVLILDWDVHHGNGTQHIFQQDPSVFYCSLHEHPSFCYPGTGFSWERGEGAGEGSTLNLPMPPHAGDRDYVEAFQNRFLPAALAFDPDFILISIGFDAHRDDPLAMLDLTQAGFDWLARQTKRLAQRCCAGRVVGMLEGGYNLDVLRACTVSLLEILLDDEDSEAAIGEEGSA